MTALVGNFGGGWLATRMSLPNLLAISLFVLAAGLAALPHVTTIGQVMAWATAMGLGGGLVMVLFFSVWPRVYGRAHLGRIQGAAQAMTVLASAIGPLLLAVVHRVDRQLRRRCSTSSPRVIGACGVLRADDAACQPPILVTDHLIPDHADHLTD